MRNIHQRPVIGLSSGTILPQRFIIPGMELVSLSRDYIEAVEAIDAVPLVIPVTGNPEDAAAIIRKCDGIVFSGGYDIHPSCYGQDSRKGTGASVYRVDMFQLALCRAVIKHEIPFLGICRGHQLVNVACGGTLYQDISEHEGSFLKHFQEGERSDTAHTVEIESDSVLRTVFGQEKIPVNSFHHQCVDRPGAGLRISAFSADGVIEAMEMENYPYGITVQWHPEMMLLAGDSMKPLFDSFRVACSIKP